MTRRISRYAQQLADIANDMGLERGKQAIGHLPGSGAMLKAYSEKIEELRPKPKANGKKTTTDFRKSVQTDIRLMECNLEWARMHLSDCLDECSVCGSKATLKGIEVPELPLCGRLGKGVTPLKYVYGW